MDKKERIVKYYETLCRELNGSGFRSKVYLGDSVHESAYEVDDEHPKLTMMDITRDAKAYQHLQDAGLLKEDMCQFCGAVPVDDTYTFTEPTNRTTLNICGDCHPNGKSGMNQSNSGCMVTLTVLIMLSLSATAFLL